MTPLSLLNLNDLGTRFSTPIPFREKAKTFWKRAFYVFMGGSIILPHANLGYAFERCLKGECYEFYYIFSESYRYLDDSFMYMVSQSLGPMATTAIGFGSLYWVSRKITAFRGTRNSPRFDLINYDSSIGSEVRDAFARSAGQIYEGDEVQLELGLDAPAQ